MAAEASARAAQQRANRLRFGLGALAVIAAVVVAVLLVSGGGNGGSSAKPESSAGAGAKLPAPAERDLAKAAKAAGCVLSSPPDEGANHTNGPYHYKSNPPTSGNHNEIPALDGIYPPGKEPAPQNYVHTLEHGRIEIQYRPGTSKQLIDQLEALGSEPLNGKPAYKTLVFENNTKMPYAVAATAWGQLLGCKTVRTPAIFDALRDFRVKYVDQGPEKGIPPNN